MTKDLSKNGLVFENVNKSYKAKKPRTDMNRAEVYVII